MIPVLSKFGATILTMNCQYIPFWLLCIQIFYLGLHKVQNVKKSRFMKWCTVPEITWKGAQNMDFLTLYMLLFWRKFTFKSGRPKNCSFKSRFALILHAVKSRFHCSNSGSGVKSGVFVHFVKNSHRKKTQILEKLRGTLKQFRILAFFHNESTTLEKLWGNKRKNSGFAYLPSGFW